MSESLRRREPDQELERERLRKRQLDRYLSDDPMEGDVLLVTPDADLRGVMVNLVKLDRDQDGFKSEVKWSRFLVKGRVGLAEVLNSLVEQYQLAENQVSLELSLGIQLRRQGWPNEETKWRESRD